MSTRTGSLLLLLVTASAVGADPPEKVDFAHEIAPLLKARCVECHANGKYKGGFSLDTREALVQTKAVVPGKSELVKRITSTDPDVRMPPKGPALTPAEVAKLRRWVDDGSPWEPGFSFKTGTYAAPLKPRHPKVPPGDGPAVDRLLAEYYARNKVTPPAAVSDEVFLRRVYLDAIGLLPTPAEADAFLKDASPDRRTALVRRLLGEKRAYAEHWLTFWNDLLRNDYAGTGYIDGGRKQISAWLYQSLYDNKPYDRFVRELIQPTPEAEGFIKGIRWRGTVNASQVVELQFAQNVSQVFFGANLKCASCHDSFIDTWKLDDAYALAAVIADRPLEIHRCDKATGRVAQARFLWPELGSIDVKQPRDKRLGQLAALATHPDNGRLARTFVNRVWQRLLGRGIVHPVDIMANRPWSDDLLDHLAVTFAEDGYDVRKLLETILTSHAYQSRPVVVGAEAVGSDYVYRGPELRRLSAEQFMDALWMLTGTGPAQASAPVKLLAHPAGVPAERRLVRAALVTSDPLMRSLGRPNREQVVTTRPDQLTTLQALDLSNGPTLADTLTRGASALVKTHAKGGDDELITDLYRRALCRRPTPEELTTARALVGSPRSVDGVADLLWAVLMLPEFQLVR